MVTGKEELACIWTVLPPQGTRRASLAIYNHEQGMRHGCPELIDQDSDHIAACASPLVREERADSFQQLPASILPKPTGMAGFPIPACWTPYCRAISSPPRATPQRGVSGVAAEHPPAKTAAAQVVISRSWRIALLDVCCDKVFEMVEMIPRRHLAEDRVLSAALRKALYRWPAPKWSGVREHPCWRLDIP